MSGNMGSSSKSKSGPTPAPQRPNGGMAHMRNSSFERVNAVVRALARAKSDEEMDVEDLSSASDDEDDEEDGTGTGTGGASEEGEGLFVKTSPQELETLRHRTPTAQNGRHHQEADGGRSPSSLTAADDEFSDGAAYVGYSAQSSPHPYGPSGGGLAFTSTSSSSATPAAMASKYAQGWKENGDRDAHKQAGGGPAAKKRTGSESQGERIVLSEAEKEMGRSRREELRAAHALGAQPKVKSRRSKRKDGKRGRKSKSGEGNISSRASAAVSVAKSWEIPRKIFHSSIGFLVLHLYLTHRPLDKIVSGLSTFLGVVVTADVIRLNSPAFERIYEKVLGFLMRESEKKQVNGVVWYLIGVITSLHVFPADIACVSIMILSWCDTSASVFGRLFGKYTPPLPNPPFASRKSLAGFMAAVAGGALTAYAFWGTSIAIQGERADGLSWHTARPAVFGTPNAPGPFATGWTGLKHGITGNVWWTGTGSNSNSGGAAAFISKAAATLTQAAVASASSAPSMPLWLLCAGSGLVSGIAESLDLGGLDDNLTLPILSATGIWGVLWAWGKVVTLLGY